MNWEEFKAGGESSLDLLCQMIEDGDSSREIAAALESSEATVRRWVADDVARSARVREARSRAALSYDEAALTAIRGASDPFELARAREEAQHLRWRASKVNPSGYGDKLDVKAAVTLRDVSDTELTARANKLMALMVIGKSNQATPEGSAEDAGIPA